MHLALGFGQEKFFSDHALHPTANLLFVIEYVKNHL